MTAKYTEALVDLKGRSEEAVEEGKQILREATPLQGKPEFPTVAFYTEAFRKAVEGLEALLGPLQKELPEALKAGAELLTRMEVSQTAFKKVLAGLSYHYGADTPEVLEFVSPPNAYGYGRESGKRLRAHQRVSEAFQRRQAEFEPGSSLRKDLERLLRSGQDLDTANKTFQKEAGEADNACRQTLQALASYRHQKSLLRRSLMMELPNPEDAYKYIPKQRSSPENASPPPPPPPAPPTPPTPPTA